jgi:copper chaperone CopZ
VLTKRITHIPGIASIESSFALGIIKQSKIYPG